MKSVRWAIIAMGVFAATATYAVAQSGAFDRLFGASDSEHAADTDAGERHAQSAQAFRWRGTLASGESLEVTGGSEIEVVAEARARRSDPGSVRIERVEHGDGLTFCAVYPTPEGERENRCAPGSEGRMNTRDNDVVVDFEIRVPADVELVARTVNGDVRADDLGADVTANTVNGDIDVSTDGFARAETVNGDIDVRMGASDFGRGAEFSTVNGSITLDVDDDVNAEIDASWLNGGFDSELPFTLQGRLDRRSARGVLGEGGPRLELQTVNGSIRIR